MNLTYKTVKGSQQERPAEVDPTSSPGLVYLRRNIGQITEPSGMGEDTITLWQYEEAALTHEQYQQYKAELENVGQQQIMDELWGYDSETDIRTVDVHINRLRDRFRDIPYFQIQTVRGLGYKGMITK